MKKLLVFNGRKLAINAGHFIPDTKNEKYIGKNPLLLWDLACQIVNKIPNSYLSVLINDLPLTVEERKGLKLDVPEQYKNILAKHDLSENIVIKDSANKNSVYAEKRLANRIDWQLRRSNKLNNYSEDDLNNYCKEAIIGYLLDIEKQEAEVSLWLLPKCCTENYVVAINCYKKAGGKIINIVYFETDNCYL